jgi:hypothetical protein
MTRILDPTIRIRPRPFTNAPRPSSLRGLTIGLLANGKSNGMAVLDRLAENLEARHGVGEVVRVRKTSASAPARPEDADRLAGVCAVVLTAIGD